MATTKKDNVKYAICYIPFGALIIFFAEDKKTDELKKHIKYGIYLLVAYILLSSLFWFMSGLLAILYLGISGFLGYKAYNGEKIDIEIIDDLEKKVKDKM